MISPRINPEVGMTAAEWFDRAVAVMPGGVNSPVRAFGAVGAEPVFAASASGPHITSLDGRSFVDFIASWGALILGHAHPVIVEAVTGTARRGTSFGIPTIAEVELAELIHHLMPSMEVVRMVNSGTEATASAIRVARAATGRSGIIKFVGNYHGHADPFLVRAGSGAAHLGLPDSPGVPPATVADTRLSRYNDLASVDDAFAAGDIGAVIVEPVAGNMGVVPPDPGFLQGLRARCDAHGSVLIFDEVMTGFRVGPAGAQGLYGVEADLTCLGKVVAGGTPAAAYGGAASLMRQVAPDGPVYQAGTLAGNPLAVAAGLACLRHLAEHPEVYDTLEKTGSRLESALADAVADEGCVQRVGAMMTVFFGPIEVRNFDDANRLDRERFARFFRLALDRGVLLPPSPFEALFLMEAHGEVVDEALETLVQALRESR
ncbi:MAG TPA: glutamate-1-semialdehyde 2,1-aminomutase [Acidimicrobiia bacterium]|nr:glutamate-1-semialdehyde 2,1-aminomutase [Acidimicrobiia bacterium]